MSISFVGAGVSAAVGGAQPQRIITPTLPSGWTADDLFVLPTYFKDYRGTLDIPSEWTFRQAGYEEGTGVAGADSGAAASDLFERVAQTGDTDPTVTLTTFDSSNVANVVMAHIMGYRKAAGTTWDTAHSGDLVRRNTNQWDASIDPGMQEGDWLVLSCVSASDSGFATLNSVTVPGCTFGTPVQRANDSTAQGGDGRIVTWDVPVTGGVSTGVATYGLSWSVLRSPVLTVLRIREVTAGGIEGGIQADALRVGSASPSAAYLGANKVWEL